MLYVASPAVKTIDEVAATLLGDATFQFETCLREFTVDPVAVGLEWYILPLLNRFERASYINIIEEETLERTVLHEFWLEHIIRPHIAMLQAKASLKSMLLAERVEFDELYLKSREKISAREDVVREFIWNQRASALPVAFLLESESSMRAILSKIEKAFFLESSERFHRMASLKR